MCSMIESVMVIVWIISPGTHLYHTNTHTLCRYSQIDNTCWISHTNIVSPHPPNSEPTIPPSFQTDPLNKNSICCNSDPSLELRRLFTVVSEKKKKFMNIVFFLITWTKVWFERALSALVDPDTAGLWRWWAWIDVTQIFRRKSSLFSRFKRAALTRSGGPADASVYKTTVLTLTPAGIYCMLDITCWPWWETFIPPTPTLSLIGGEQVRVKHNFVWEFRVHYVFSSALWELFQEGKRRWSSRLFCTKLQCVLLISCTVNLTSHFD